MFSKDGKIKDIKTPRICDAVWHDGEFIKWQDAKVHVMSHVLHYGSSIFEGIRCYSRARRRDAESRSAGALRARRDDSSRAVLLLSWRRWAGAPIAGAPRTPWNDDGPADCRIAARAGSS